MTKIFLICLVVASIFAVQGCASGVITADQQKAKQAALKKVAAEDYDPNREVRPQ